ncbi:alpha-2-macroglobulin domain protein [Myxococcus hansupus]|uniref:Alpha-2-macroglobulin domain protein n=1 Tax=Pseudomyxococcus hansupus TaxID=1297742 RepID=A0A0H4X5U8_9BACT|nr:MG2 domain-containing protein [Myxococcus hansupus]AKQ69268.1 alpha-2-macroglobulin domain protein [Myxococcus hansupus]
MTIRIRRRRLVGGGLAALLVGGAVAFSSWDVCFSAWAFKGVNVPACPDGQFRQVVELNAHGLVRGGQGHVSLLTVVMAPHPKTGVLMHGGVSRGTASVFLVDAEGKETPLALAEGEAWQRSVDTHRLSAKVLLPEVPDGDYQLRARVTTPVGTDTVDAALPLYSPARAHVLTDRPLYEPGHEVLFRAVALRSKDLSPLDGRPGTWRVKDPSGEVVLEERAPAGPWGVVAGRFPLDRGAPQGWWSVSWSSGAVEAQAPFQVKPFTLPRFRVDVRSARPFWRAEDVPVVEGQVVYASGAPVSDVEVALTWNVQGDWPPPTEWTTGALPDRARTDATGRFRLVLPRVPMDLRGQAWLSARVVARDASGDRIEGRVSLLLSEDALAVSTVTELDGGLAPGFNNRVYLRATTAAGQVLPNAELTVTRAWDPHDEGVRAVTDEDGVASFQLDPGPPVNVVVPPMPVRPPPPEPTVRLGETRSLLAPGHEASLADMLALEKSLPALEPCARFVSRDEGLMEVELGLRVGASGAVLDVVAGEGALPACMASVLRARALSAGVERVLHTSFVVSDPNLPSVEVEVETAFGVPDEVVAAMNAAARDARTCLPRNLSMPASPPVAASWRLGTRGLESLTWVPVAADGSLPASVTSCIQERFARIRLPESAQRGVALGVARLSVLPAGDTEEGGSSMATTFLGYELKVRGTQGGEDVGETKLALRPAEVPKTRLRATPVLARGGEEVRIELLRGPQFLGQLPDTLVLQAGQQRFEEKVDKATRSVRFKLPENFEGWALSYWEGAQGRVYVAPRAQLSVEVSPEKPRYAPGELARLQIRTRVDGQDGPAAVGLFGVDETLAQLAPLPGPDAMSSVQTMPTVASPAFGVFDGQALAMGRIRGANASAAAVLRVTDAPQRDGTEPSMSASAVTSLDADAELTEPFYAVLAELHTQVRTWEEKAPQGQTLDPAGMARLWEDALAACEKRGEKVTDAFGRKLKLSRLPTDLLALTDPRSVVSSGTRLPEDVENWNAWVAREAP